MDILGKNARIYSQLGRFYSKKFIGYKNIPKRE
jgi:hypothetical protein